uniref:Transcription factor UNE12 n=1 Tax=Elaeis guineensis var. tenera TaxID=51953 RepID=A0A6I9QZD6_ELAGV|nr:transcription factor UNE12 [Elaeis guineensis]
MRVLQELVPISHKSDYAVMLDKIVDYVKFLMLQVKVPSMSRLGVAGAVAQVVADIPLSSVEKISEGGGRKPVWERWSNNGMDEQVVKLMEDVESAMRFLQSEALCIIPISINTTIHQFCHQNEIPAAKPEPNAPS